VHEGHEKQCDYLFLKNKLHVFFIKTRDQNSGQYMAAIPGRPDRQVTLPLFEPVRRGSMTIDPDQTLSSSPSVGGQ